MRFSATSYESVGGVAYVVNDAYGFHGIDLRLYAETNGLAGLQRGGTSLATGEMDHCAPHPHPDTLIL